MTPQLVTRYLELLGVPAGPPGVDQLHALVQAQVYRVPFETVSKLYYMKRFGRQTIPDLETYLDGVERYHFGGTCYTTNYYFNQLLAHLGYDVQLCGADMSDSDVHMVSMLELEQRQYLIDVGYAAPFAVPLPRDLQTDYEIQLGNTRYVLRPQDAQGCSRIELHRDGELKHGYLAKPEPRAFAEFADVIHDSYSSKAEFMNSLLLARFFPNRSLVIRNLSVVDSRGPEFTRRTLANRNELIGFIASDFGIPPHITAEAIDGLSALEGA